MSRPSDAAEAPGRPARCPSITSAIHRNWLWKVRISCSVKHVYTYSCFSKIYRISTRPDSDYLRSSTNTSSILTLASAGGGRPAFCGHFPPLLDVETPIGQEEGLLTDLAAKGKTRNEQRGFRCTFFSASIAVVLSIGPLWGVILAGSPRSRSSDFVSSNHSAPIPVRESSA
jgi:hypothetical protein